MLRTSPHTLTARFFPLFLLGWSLLPLPAAGKTWQAEPQSRPAARAQQASNANSAPSLLPQTFAGWQMTGAPQQATDPAAADGAAAAALREYGFTRYEAANYSRDDGTLQVKAIQFQDATGAFGAFTLYRLPNMRREQIGSGAAFDGKRVLFWSGAVLVDASFEHITGMSAAELRDLAQQLPRASGNAGTLPTLQRYLPDPHLLPMTLRYMIGPAAYQLDGGVLPLDLVDFGRSAEVVTAEYNALNGTGTLTLINYPTPQIAVDRENAIRAFIREHQPGKLPWPGALDASNPAAIQTRRSGPIVAVTSGAFSAEDAQQLLQRVHYEVNLTLSNSTGYVSDSAKLAQLILNIALLVGIFAVIAIVAAVSLGTGRLAWRKMRGKPAIPEDESAEFIRLNLKE